MSTSYLNRLGAIDFSSTIERLEEGFVGREWLFTKLDSWLQDPQGEQFYVLTGEPGVGKSAIVAMLTKMWANNDKPEVGQLAAYHFCRAGDVETVRPGRVLRSLATQLGKTLPHYGEALEQVLDKVHLRIDVDINIDTLSNSQVTGIYVENLKDLDPKEELRLLIQAPLAALSDIYKERGIMPTVQKIFLIDSLDEAATTTGQENMVTLLSSLYQTRETLPPWVRFLLTARPDRVVLNRFLPLQSEKIEEMEEDNLSDVKDYIQGRVDNQLPWDRSTPERRANTAPISQPKPLAERLASAHLTPETLIDKVKDLSHGNFLYTKLLLNSIASGEQSIKNLAALPKTLNDIYHRILRYRCSFRGWLKRYQPILGTLSVTQEPISQAQLSKFIGIKPEDLKKDLDIFQQFLNESKDERGQPLYTIFHQSLREYLLDKNQNHDFWCDVQEQHDNIIQCFEDESNEWQDLQAIDLYGLRHLAQHLVRANQIEKLHDLLKRERYVEKYQSTTKNPFHSAIELLTSFSEKKKDISNAWFDAKDRVGDTAGFLADVSLAWEQTELEPASSEAIARQFYYALTTSSLNTLILKMPSKILAAAVAKNIFPLEKSLTYLSYILKYGQGIDDRGMEILVELAPHLSQFLLKTIIDVINKIENLYKMANCLLVLLPYLQSSLKANVLEKIIEMIPNLEHKTSQAEILANIISYLPEPQKSEKLKIALALVQDEYSQATVSVKLFPYLSGLEQEEAIRKAKITAESISIKFLRLKELMILSPWLVNLNLLDDLLISVRSFEDESWRAAWLAHLSSLLMPPRKQQVLQEALVDIQVICSKSWQESKAISQTAGFFYWHKLPEGTMPETLLGQSYSKAMADIADSLAKSGLQQEALALVKAMWLDSGKAEAMRGIIPHLSEPFIKMALKIAQSIRDTSERSKTIGIVASRLVEPLRNRTFNELINTSKNLEVKYARSDVLSEIALYLPDTLLHKAIALVQEFDDRNERDYVLVSLLPHLPEVNLVERGLNLAQIMESEWAKEKALIGIAPRLPKSQLNTALNLARKIDYPSNRASALIAIAIQLTEPQKSKVLQEAASLPLTAYDSEERIVALAPYLSDSIKIRVLRKVLKETKNIVGLAPHLPKSLLNEAIEIARKIQDKSDKFQALNSLLPYISEPIRNKVLLDAMATVHSLEIAEARKVFGLLTLVPNLPESLRNQIITEALSVIREIQTRAETLKGGVPHLPEALKCRMLEGAISLQVGGYPAIERDLMDRVSNCNLPEPLKREAVTKILEAAKELPVTQRSIVSGLIKLIPHISEPLKSEISSEALTIARELQTMYYTQSIKASIFIEMIPYLTEPMKSEVLIEALVAARAIQEHNEEERKEKGVALAQLADYLSEPLKSEVLGEALISIQTIEGKEYERLHGIETLVPHLLKLPLSSLYTTWCQILHTSSNRERKALLVDMSALAPVISQLGGSAAAEKTIQVLANVERWWP
jgi:endonuclease V-like protein UPF0215 family